MGATFHGYEIKEKIGSGAMSTVYRGLHGTLRTPVAVKVLHPGLAGDESFIARFEREARAVSSLQHDNIARVIDFGAEDDTYFIVMEYIEGSDLQKLMADLRRAAGRARPLPAEIALPILEEVAHGLKAAHAIGIIHRDMKPSNVLLSSEGEVKIADFGLARDTRDFARLSARNLTQPGMVIGTPSYLSPEQAAGRDDLDHRTDIFSLGVMACQLLTGEQPFKGDSPTTVQESIINDAPAPLTSEACPLLTPEISGLIGRMLAKDRARRYQSMDQVLLALEECMENSDRSGALIKHRRDHLARFAREPVVFAEELQRRADASGRSPAVSARPVRAADDPAGRTPVMPPAPAASPARPRSWASAPGARWAVASMLVAVVVTAVALGNHLFAPPPPLAEVIVKPGRTTTGPPADALPAAADLPATAAAAAEPSELRPAAATGRGYARVTVAPFADVYLDGRLVKEGATVAVIEAEAGRHTVSLRHRPSYGRLDLPAFRIAAGETTALGRQLFARTGTLRVAATPAASVTIDGLDTGQQTPFLQMTLQAGEHTIGVRCPGHVVTGALDAAGGGALPVERGAGGEGRVRIRLAEGQELRIRFALSRQ